MANGLTSAVSAAWYKCQPNSQATNPTSKRYSSGINASASAVAAMAARYHGDTRRGGTVTSTAARTSAAFPTRAGIGGDPSCVRIHPSKHRPRRSYSASGGMQPKSSTRRRCWGAARPDGRRLTLAASIKREVAAEVASWSSDRHRIVRAAMRLGCFGRGERVPEIRRLHVGQTFPIDASGGVSHFSSFRRSSQALPCT